MAYVYRAGAGKVVSRWAFALLLLSTACGRPDATELVLEFASDLRVPEDLDTLRISVSGEGSSDPATVETHALGKAAMGKVELPARTVITTTASPPPTAIIVAEGLLAGKPVVGRRVLAAMEKGKSLFLRIDLVRDCVGRMCPAEQTCERGGVCKASRLPAGTLKPFDPAQPKVALLPTQPKPIGGQGGMAGSAGMGTAGTGGSSTDAPVLAPMDAGTRDALAADRPVDAPIGIDAPVMLADALTATDVKPAQLGEACKDNNQCVSNFCVDGVCCNSSCKGSCRACNVKGQEGECWPVPSGQDPKNECSDEGARTCGRDGFCDGAGACRKYTAGTECFAAQCSGFTRILASTCDGKGICVSGSTLSCAPFLCGTDGNCRATCTDNNQCLPGNACAGGSCGKKPPGAACTKTADCESGFCEQGVCCNTSCNGKCRSCALPGSQGSCTNVPDGQDTLDQCDVDATSTCGNDGMCNGLGACRKYGNATVCGAPSCSGTTATTARTCNGSGQCQSASTIGCEPFACGATECRTTCTSAMDCAPGSACVMGVCQGKRSNGATCSKAEDCLSNSCADGVCCNSACGGVCEACNVSGKLGTCSPIPNNTDPSDECADDGAGMCGKNGMCNGARACALYAAGTVCAMGSCMGSTKTLPSVCNGTGMCVAGTTQACAPFQCGPGGDCLTSCSTNTECVSPQTCVMGSCGKKPNGQACSSASECNSNFCEQGICCGSACSGTCQSCALPASAGTCTPVPAGQDPLSQCDDQTAATCGTNGACNGMGACQLYGNATECQAATCTAGGYQAARTCNGMGVCSVAQAMSCGAYACASSGCKTSCTSNLDCAAGNVCMIAASGGTCVPNPENCSNGVDDDADGKVDCADSDCTAFACVPTAPMNWKGPVAMFDGIPANDPGCPTAFSKNEFNAGRNLDCPSAACSTCNCASPTGVNCNPPTLGLSTDGVCGNPTPLTPSNRCSVIDNAVKSITASGPSADLSNASCAPSQVATTKPTAAYSNFGRACSPATLMPGGCAAATVCAPRPSTPFESQLCIYRAGNFACPSPYTANPRTFFGGFSDTRGCSACSCGGAGGVTCRGTVSIYFNGIIEEGCTGTVDQEFSVPAGKNFCHVLGNNPILGKFQQGLTYQGAAPSGGSCPAGGGVAGGGCTPTNPVTVCCLPVPGGPAVLQ